MERAIPSALLQQAAGYAILSVVKVGMGWSAAVGTGLVVARREDGSWSPPSAVGLSSFGWGIQAGGELTDLLLVLSSTETVKVCCFSAHLICALCRQRSSSMMVIFSDSNVYRIAISQVACSNPSMWFDMARGMFQHNRWCRLSVATCT